MPRNQAGHGGDQHARVRLPWTGEDILACAHLDHASAVHYDDPIGNLGNDAEVMGDKHHGRVVLLLQLADQGEDLGLRGDVERGRRLVGDQELGLQDQGHRNDDALALAAGQLMGISVVDLPHIWQVYGIEHGEHPFAALGPGELAVHAQYFVDLFANRLHRVERCHRLLEHHRHAGGAQRPKTTFARGQDVLVLHQDAAAGGCETSARQQSHDRKRGDRFAGTGFTHYAQSLALVDIEADIRDDALARGFSDHLYRKAVDPQHLCAHSLRAMRGSSASRMASPITLTLNTVSARNRPA